MTRKNQITPLKTTFLKHSTNSVITTQFLLPLLVMKLYMGTITHVTVAWLNSPTHTDKELISYAAIIINE